MIEINELDKVEILTLQDNFIDMTARDDSAVIHRGGLWEKGKDRKSLLAEHGFSALIRTTRGERTRTLLFDLGFSEIGAAYNARTLEIPMGEVEVVALSHGHGDHQGGLAKLLELIGRPGIELVVHPAAFKERRYTKMRGADFKAWHPLFTRQMVAQAGATVVEAKEPLPLLGGDVLFLGEIPRRTDFETGVAPAFYEVDGVEKRDAIEDDSSIVMHLRGKGLVVLSGCAHAGIVNTVLRAREATGIDKVHVIMGGFHLNGPAAEPIVGRTIEAFKAFDPAYIVPTHCTGRTPIQRMEAALPDRFVLNMAGTRLTFAA
jgi:7,8-dihydropterin-6-yl-methyl-4-(beta-D-ribofuranosyl)aminobenzene 5'-phosphate synthase